MPIEIPFFTLSIAPICLGLPSITLYIVQGLLLIIDYTQMPEEMNSGELFYYPNATVDVRIVLPFSGVIYEEETKIDDNLDCNLTIYYSFISFFFFRNELRDDRTMEPQNSLSPRRNILGSIYVCGLWIVMCCKLLY